MKSTFVHSTITSVLLASCLLLTGCVQMTLGNPVASIDNIQKAKAASMVPVAIGDFSPVKNKDNSWDAGISIRSNTLSSPFEKSFAKYLKETLTVELRAAGLLDPSSGTIINGTLLDSQIDASIGQGKGSITAQFVVTRGGKTLYDKVLTSSATWESSFVGAAAIPAAVNQYSALHRKLVGILLDDSEFRKVMAR